jgi:hypothetical protein
MSSVGLLLYDPKNMCFLDPRSRVSLTLILFNL